MGPRAAAGDAPGWMHALVQVPLPAYDEKTDVVLLYSEKIVTVQSADKIKTLTRAAYKILRPNGREMGTVVIPFDAQTRIRNLHGWCIPAQGKDYEVKDKDGAEVSLPGVPGSELITDVRAKVLRIPAPDPGNIVGYEYEQEDRPYLLQDVWRFQRSYPVHDARFTLQLPAGWEFKASWRNHAEAPPSQVASNQWQWQLSNVPAIKAEQSMPPWQALAGQMVVSPIPPGGAPQSKRFSQWRDLGLWYDDLARGRRDATPEIKQKVAELTARLATPLDRMRALAGFLQEQVRYVAIELGIGGFQPHAAGDVFRNRYGDCKDKATLLSAMLRETGIDSYFVIINHARGAVTSETPAFNGFDHMILAIRLPDAVSDPALLAVKQHPKLGRLLIFDPTDRLTPLGKLNGALQANYGLLVTAEGGELLQLPAMPAEANGILRSAKLALSPSGSLSGEVQELRYGDRGAEMRESMRNAASQAEKVKPLETLLAHSLAGYHLTRAAIGNVEQIDQPFLFKYSFVADNYAQSAGPLLLVRTRVLGHKSSDVLETREPRKYAVELDSSSRDTDIFEITLPAGYEVDDLPPPVTADYSFASYHSRTEVNGNTLRYSRTFEVKEPNIPLGKVDELKRLYRIIAADERTTAVLKPVAH